MILKSNLSIALISALLITFLFHRQALGLNLFIAEVVLFLWLISTKQYIFKGKNQIISGAGFLITSIFTVLTHSLFSYIIHILTLFIFIGILIYPNAKSLLTSAILSFRNLLFSQLLFSTELSKTNGNRPIAFIWKTRFFIIPSAIIALFIFLYQKSNPIFDKLTLEISNFIHSYINLIFKNFDGLIVFTFLFGLSISNLFLFKTSNQLLIKDDLTSTDEIKRIKSKNIFGIMALKNEYKAGVFLFLILNLVLLILNSIDIYWVWFNFKWEGQYLKQFVHEATYLLILSILISIGLVLFFFRNNLNFYKSNKWLKHLSYMWLLQNLILTISVAIRNLYYINYFSLAYKRIGVILFLLLTLYGLYTVMVKVRQQKSSFYLVKTNTAFLLIVLVISSTINWDNVIAKYNFSHSNNSFLHLNYMATLSDKSLPLLNIPLEKLNQIGEIQKTKFPFEQEYMTSEVYHEIIERRKSLL